MGGWLWGGTDEQEATRTIHAALEKGINLIDTASAYDCGRSEELVGKALAAYGHRDHVVLATKAGLEWRAGEVFRNGTRADSADTLRLPLPSPVPPSGTTIAVFSFVNKWETQPDFNENSLMWWRLACINDLPIKESDRKYHWPLGPRPDGHPELTDLGF
jgi:Aldo/keto reductase family